jgi:hypothetical protein
MKTAATTPSFYREPVRVSDRVLLTCRGIAIGGAFATTDRAAVSRHVMSLQAAPMSTDSILIQCALLDKRTAAQPSALRRVINAAVRPLINFC